MSSLNKMLITALVVQVALAAFMLTRSDSTTIRKLEPVVAEFDKDTINRIEIYKEPIGGKDSDVAIQLDKKSGSWVLASHHDYPVTGSNVTDLLDKVLAMSTRGPVATSAARQSQLAVADDEYKRKLVLHGAGEPITLYVGNPAGSRKAAVRLAGSDEIHGVTGVSMAALSTSMSSWIELEYFEVEQDNVASFTITNPQGTFTLERAGESWNLTMPGSDAPGTAPGTTPAGQTPATPPADRELDTNDVNDLLERIVEINLVEPADPAHKLEKPLATFVLRMKPPAADEDGDAGPSSAISPVAEEYSFEFGDEKDGKYFLRRSGAEHAIWISTGTLKSVLELDKDTLYKETKDDAAGGEAPPDPGAIQLPGIPGAPLVPGIE